MAGEWIAMRHDLWECPQVVRIVSAMCPQNVQSCPQNVRDMSMRCQVIGALFRTWCIFDRFTEDGILIGYTAEILNDEVGISGWAENLEHVGWLIIDKQSVIVPDFADYFGESAKRRLKDRKRKAESRKTCPQNVRNPADKKRTTEQNRTEQKKNKKTPTPFSLPESLDTPEFARAWSEWQTHRAEIRKPLTPTQMVKQMQQFAQWGEARAIAAINHTIEKGWQGIREPDPEHAGNGRQKTPAEYLEEARRKERERENSV